MNAEANLSTTSATKRFQSIDLMRGAVMVLMAIDHVRVYSGLPAGGTAPGIFFTRWITHFCAPSFVFFAGTSIFLYGLQINDRKKLSGYLLTRGLMLVILELTLIKFCWTFNLDYSSFILAGIIWMLGWCMILFTLFLSLRPNVVGFIGVGIILLQSVFKAVPHLLPVSMREPFGKFWEFIYPSGLEAPPNISVLYVIVPWIGVMAAGYGFGTILILENARFRRLCFSIGFAAIITFLVTGSFLTAMQPLDADSPPFIFRLLNQTKYPASALFIFMTLGPVITLIPFAEKVKGWFVKVLVVFGRVPLFYYLLHIPLIHLSALLVNSVRSGATHSEFYSTAPYTFLPEEMRWPLALLYLIFILDVILLYFVCRWYASYKAAHPEKNWLKWL